MIRKLLVTGQSAKNTLKIVSGESGCCGDNVTDCQYTATYTQANSISLLNITEAGVARALPCVVAGGATAAVAKAAILATLVAAGYEDDNNTLFDGVVVTDLGTTCEVIITGNVVPVSLTTSGGVVTFDPDCTKLNLCTFATTGYAGGTSPSAATTLRINGVNYDIGTVTPGTTSAGTVATAVQAAITAAGASVTGTAGVTTTGSGGSQTYNITITLSNSDNTFVLAGTQLARSGCVATYV